MSPAEFTGWAESYYGTYAPVVKAEVMKWCGNHSGILAALYVEIRNNYPNRFRMPPDVATLREYEKAARERMYAAIPRKQIEADPIPVLTDAEREEVLFKMHQMFLDLTERKRVKS